MVHPSAESSDEELAQQAGRGDHAAFSALVRKYSQRFYRAAYRILRNGNEAEEVVQQAYLKYWSDPRLFDPSRGVKWSTWFYRVVLNACLDRSRRRGREVYSDAIEASPNPAPTAEQDLESLQKNRALTQALGALPERQRSALQLCFWEGLSNQEAADVLGLRLKALQSLLVRGKENLRAALRPEWRLKPS